MHEVDIKCTEHVMHETALFKSDSVLTGNRSPEPNAHPENLAGQRLRSFELAAGDFRDVGAGRPADRSPAAS